MPASRSVSDNVGEQCKRWYIALYLANPNLDNARVERGLSGRVGFANILQDSFGWGRLVYLANPNLDNARVERGLSGRVGFANILQDSFGWGRGGVCGLRRLERGVALFRPAPVCWPW